VDEALAGLPDEDRAAAPEPVDYRWLGVGMRLGLERPERCRLRLGGRRRAYGRNGPHGRRWRRAPGT
jgi:hypothetical protein